MYSGDRQDRKSSVGVPERLRASPLRGPCRENHQYLAQRELEQAECLQVRHCPEVQYGFACKSFPKANELLKQEPPLPAAAEELLQPWAAWRGDTPWLSNRRRSAMSK